MNDLEWSAVEGESPVIEIVLSGGVATRVARARGISCESARTTW